MPLTTPETLPDIEGALRTWLRAQTSVTTLLGGQRVFFGIPKGATEASFPLITVARVGGGLDGSDAPVDSALIQWDVWGSIDASGNGKKAEATTLVNTLRSLLAAVRGRTELTASVDIFGCVEQSCIWLPDADNDRPRYSLTTEVIGISS